MMGPHERQRLIEAEAAHGHSVDGILDRQARARDRMNAIVSAPEAEGRDRVAFALACRRDIPTDRAVALLSVAPANLSDVRDVWAWIDAIPPQPEVDTEH